MHRAAFPVEILVQTTAVQYGWRRIRLLKESTRMVPSGTYMYVRVRTIRKSEIYGRLYILGYAFYWLTLPRRGRIPKLKLWIFSCS